MSAASALPNISPDLIWQIVRGNHSYLTKSRSNGRAQFSYDPLNLTNKNTRKHAGFVNEKAIGVVANEKGGVTVTSKKASAAHQPASSHTKTTHGGNKTSRKTYKAVANQAARSGYRPDLRQYAVERVSAIRRTQRPVKPEPEPKLRGNKAKKAAEEEA